MTAIDDDLERRYRERAQQLRGIAAGLDNDDARTTLLKAAQEYEQLAESARLRLRTNRPSGNM
jgi:hypothetical protein